MATSSGSSATDSTNTSPAEQLKAALATADSTVTQGIQNLQSVHQARLAQATRTVVALTAQYGADDPRVKTAEAAVTVRNTTIARISMVRQQLAAPAIQIAQAGWALQGRVLDAQLQPVARFTVFLVDANKEFLSSMVSPTPTTQDIFCSTTREVPRRARQYRNSFSKWSTPKPTRST